MNIDEFLNKWGYSPARGYGNALFDRKDALLRDFTEVAEEEILKKIQFGTAEHPIKISAIAVIKIIIKIRKLIRQLRRKNDVLEKETTGNNE